MLTEEILPPEENNTHTPCCIPLSCACKWYVKEGTGHYYFVNIVVAGEERKEYHTNVEESFDEPVFSACNVSLLLPPACQEIGTVGIASEKYCHCQPAYSSWEPRRCKQ